MTDRREHKTAYMLNQEFRNRYKVVFDGDKDHQGRAQRVQRHDMFDSIVEGMADIFQGANDLFDRERFIALVYLP